jgi:hypothetical protein
MSGAPAASGGWQMQFIDFCRLHGVIKFMGDHGFHYNEEAQESL